jgi:hypothetical protein
VGSTVYASVWVDLILSVKCLLSAPFLCSLFFVMRDFVVLFSPSVLSCFLSEDFTRLRNTWRIQTRRWASFPLPRDSSAARYIKRYH